MQNIDFSIKDKQLVEKLKAIDWDFSNKSAKRDIHSIHPYPAKFIPEIPRHIIESIQMPEDTWILDPFCGSGTTLVEAQKNGIPSIGVDLNPIACLISKVKVTSINKNLIDYAIKCIEIAKEYNDVDVDEIKKMKNIDHWFKEDIQYSLSTLLTEIEKVEDESIKNALKFCYSSIIVRVSNQESDTRYAAIDKNVKSEDVFSNFLNACKNLVKEKEKDTNSSNIESIIINKDILQVSEEDIGKRIGLVITSPPYPNAYEYWLYHKYRMRWLGYDDEKVKKKEIGARAHYFKKQAQTAEDFNNQMTHVFDLLNNVVVKNGYICFVIGRSIIKGEVIDNASSIVNIAESAGLLTVFNETREIAPSRKSFNLSHANIKQENILIFKKVR